MVVVVIIRDIVVIIRLMAHESKQTKEFACRALRQMCVEESIRGQVVQQGGLKACIAIAADEECEVGTMHYCCGDVVIMPMVPHAYFTICVAAFIIFMWECMHYHAFDVLITTENHSERSRPCNREDAGDHQSTHSLGAPTTGSHAPTHLSVQRSRRYQFAAGK